MPAQKSKRSTGKIFSTVNKSKKDIRTKLLCRECKAVYNGKGWIAFEKMDPKMTDELKMSICPACHETIDHVSDGILHIKGSGVQAHTKDIKNLIIHMGKNAEEKNILDRIERIEENGNEMTVYTTLNQLAVRIGKNVASAYKGGKLDIQWSRNDKPVEVIWTYEKKEKK